MPTELTLDQRAFVLRITNDPVLMEVIRMAIEDELIDLRDRDMWIGLPKNGFTCRGRNGENPIGIRLSTPDGIKLGLRALAEATPERLAGLDAQWAKLQADG